MMDGDRTTAVDSGNVVSRWIFLDCPGKGAACFVGLGDRKDRPGGMREWPLIDTPFTRGVMPRTRTSPGMTGSARSFRSVMFLSSRSALTFSRLAHWRSGWS